jgi:hypothetical protein
MGFKSNFKVYENNGTNYEPKTQKLKWSDQIMLEKKSTPRAGEMSPLAQWWIKEQIKDKRQL